MPRRGQGVIEPGSCRSSGLQEALLAEERHVGAPRALEDYCEQLSRQDPERRALAAHRLAQLSRSPDLGQGTVERTYRCVARALKEAGGTPPAEHLAQALALLGTSIGQYAQVLRQLADCPSVRARVAGYESVWANGRLALLPHIQQLLRRGPVAQRSALVRGFARGRVMSAAERRPVCALLTELLADEPLPLADVAAQSLARVCPAERAKLVQAVERRRQRGTATVALVRSLSVSAGYFEHKASMELLQAIVQTLERISADGRQDQTTRTVAQMTLARLTTEQSRP